MNARYFHQEAYRQAYRQAPLWLSACVVGLLAILYAKIVFFVESWYFYLFEGSPYWVSIASPFLFVLAVYLVRRFAPEARGSGIPQIIQVIELSKGLEHSRNIHPKTAFVKILSSIVD